jgi:hypothetical protein
MTSPHRTSLKHLESSFRQKIFAAITPDKDLFSLVLWKACTLGGNSRSSMNLARGQLQDHIVLLRIQIDAKVVDRIYLLLVFNNFVVQVR